MRKHLLFLLLSFLTLTVAQGQTNVYHPFPENNAFWNERIYGLNYNHTCSTENNYALFIHGDTLIGANTYHKLYKQGYSVYVCVNPPTNPIYSYYGAYYQCAIRQDSLHKKVFMYDTHSFKDMLLYDFNLNVGDTLASTIFNAYPKFVVKKIDSVLVGNKYHKRFTYQGNPPIQSGALVEGIGDVTFGLYNLKGFYPDGGSNFLCFAHHTAIYPVNSNCQITTEIAETSNPTNSILIFPNPFSTQATLQADRVMKKASLTIYNLFGQAVRQMDDLAGQTIVFYRDNLPTGLYFIRLTQDNKLIATEKLVVADN